MHGRREPVLVDSSLRLDEFAGRASLRCSPVGEVSLHYLNDAMSDVSLPTSHLKKAIPTTASEAEGHAMM
jgi:hypothetical protein